MNALNRSSSIRFFTSPERSWSDCLKNSLSLSENVTLSPVTTGNTPSFACITKTIFGWERRARSDCWAAVQSRASGGVERVMPAALRVKMSRNSDRDIFSGNAASRADRMPSSWARRRSFSRFSRRSSNVNLPAFSSVSAGSDVKSRRFSSAGIEPIKRRIEAHISAPVLSVQPFFRASRGDKSLFLISSMPLYVSSVSGNDFSQRLPSMSQV